MKKVWNLYKKHLTFMPKYGIFDLQNESFAEPLEVGIFGTRRAAYFSGSSFVVFWL